MGQGRLEDNDVGPVAVNVKACGQFGDGIQVGGLIGHRGQQLARASDVAGELLLVRLPLGAKPLRIALELDGALQDVYPGLMSRDTTDLDAEGKTVQKLGAQLAFFRVHGAYQDKARRMAKGDPFTLHDVAAHRCRVEQEVHNVIVQQVYLVHVEEAPVGGGQHAGLELFLAGLDRHLDVQRTDDAILGRADRQVHESGPVLAHGQRFPPAYALAAVVAQSLRAVGITMEGTVGNNLDLGQQSGQRAGCRRLGRASLATDQHATDSGADGIEDQPRFHRFLADDGCEGKDSLHM